MDFFQFLQKSSQSSQSTESKESSQSKQKTIVLSSENNKKSTGEELINNQETTVYKNIKKGDLVKIIYIKDSILNTYKGYIGEIKEYRKDMDSAVIFLHCITSFTSIKFPIEHFIKINSLK